MRGRKEDGRWWGGRRVGGVEVMKMDEQRGVAKAWILVRCGIWATFLMETLILVYLKVAVAAGFA